MNRLSHFYWLSTEPCERDLDFQMFAALHSWLVHHPHWTTTLFTNCEFKGPLFGFCA
jgi:hypothetical protein